MTKVIWVTDEKMRYSLNDLLDSIRSNTHSKDPSFRKKVMVGLTAHYGYTLRQLLQYGDLSAMLTVKGDKMSQAEIDEKTAEHYRSILDSYQSMTVKGHPDFLELRSKLGAIHNVLNCGKWTKNETV